MLGKKSRSQAPIGTLVGAETRVHGDVEFAGGFHVDGYVKGNVEPPRTRARVLSVSERGSSKARSSCRTCVLNGTVKGDIRRTSASSSGLRRGSSATCNTS